MHSEDPTADAGAESAARETAAPAPSAVAGTPRPDIEAVIEAALLAAGQPLDVAQLAALFGEDEGVDAARVREALAALDAACEGRGVELVEVASGFRYQVRRQVYPWVARLWTERQTRYSRALLETLSLIAYRQPITRGEIERIRGVAVNTQIVKTLEERGWVRVVGHRDVPGKPELLGTTRAFLDYFNLKSLDELPPLAEIREIGELEPELPFDAGPRSDSGGEPPEPGLCEPTEPALRPVANDAAPSETTPS